MVVSTTGCLFPGPTSVASRVGDCTPEICDTQALYSIVSARCPLDLSYNKTLSSLPSSSSKLLRTRCMLNRTTDVFYWLPPIENCFSARITENEPYFYGSIYKLRQLQQAFQVGKAAAVAVREKPLVSLSVGMSALSVVLVLIMLLGVCHRNAASSGGSSGSGGGRSSSSTQRQAAARRRARNRIRRLQNANHSSVATQADVESQSDHLFILPRPQLTRRPQTGGVNAGFHDSEALLAQPHDLLGQTPSVLPSSIAGSLVTIAHEGADEDLAGDLGDPGEGAHERQSSATTDSGHADEDVSHLFCFSVPHIDVVNEYQPPNNPPKIFRGLPMLPTYEDATKRGMYCIIRPQDITAPPAYQWRLSAGFPTTPPGGDPHVLGPPPPPVPADDDDGSDSGHRRCLFPSVTSWDFETYGLHRGSVNSMPEFSQLFGPPDSPYPDSPQ